MTLGGILLEPFVHLHTHTDLSNSNMFESITSVSDYVEQAKMWSMPAICITNHGSVGSWLSNKLAVEEAGLKYIHGIEAYVTDDNNDMGEDDKYISRTRDNFHLVLIAKNWEGVKEINRLSSNSYNREDNHFYHNPRIFFDELVETSKNVIILTGCLGSALNQHRLNNIKQLKKWESFLIENKDRVYLEVQPHLDNEQGEYNAYLIDLANKHNMKIVATNDVHNLNMEYSDIAKAIKNSKGIKFDTDDNFYTDFKSRDAMKKMFVEQGVLSETQIEDALNNTIEIVNRVENFEVDTSIRYPHIFRKNEQMVGQTNVSTMRSEPFDNSLDLFRHLIALGYRERGLDKLPKEEQEKYKKQVNHELDTYITTDSIDYMLLEYSLKKEAREKVIDPNKSIKYGYGRGSVGGSLIAYLLYVTEVDPVANDLVFERFMSPDRVGVPDIDTDWFSQDREKIVDYLIDREDLNCAVIMTKGSYATKGAIKAIGKTLGYDAQEMNSLSKEYTDHDDTITADMKDRYPDIFDKIEKVEGTVSNYGRHAGGVLVSSENIKEIIGLQTLGSDNRWITQLDMDEIEFLNLIKLDVLGLDNIGLINGTIEMAGLPYITTESDMVDMEDDNVWNSIAEDNTGIFQFESDRAGKILSDIISPENVKLVRETTPDVSRLEMMSLANASQRPSGLSYIEAVTNGEFKDNGHKALNEFLSDTQGFLVYQEQNSEFLVRFAGFKKSEADTVRKGIAKKRPEIMDKIVPTIEPNFIKTMVEEYGDTEEHAREIAKDFIQVFMDSVDYGFNKSHSIAYSQMGYISGWLRYYYPLEFIATALEIWQKKDKEVEFIKYAEKHDISINPPKFRKSKGGYFVDKENNAIFQGTGHIKGNNAQTAESLYQLKDRDYPTFTDLVIDVIENSNITYENNNFSIQDFYKKYDEDEVKAIDKEWKKDELVLSYEKYPLGINKTKMHGLIKLNFFEEFGKPKKLVQVYDYVLKNYKPNNKTFSNKHKKYHECLEFEDSLENEDFSIVEQCEHELELTGRVSIQSDTIPPKYAFVTEVDERKTRTTATVYSISKGASTQIKVGSRVYKQAKFKEGDLIELQDMQVKAKRVQQDGQWIASPTEKELWVKQLKFIRKTKIK